MHSLTVDYHTFSIEEKVAVVGPETSVAVAHSEVISTFLCFVDKVIVENARKSSTRINVWKIVGGCLFERVLTICCSSLLEDAKAILSE